MATPNADGSVTATGPALVPWPSLEYARYRSKLRDALYARHMMPKEEINALREENAELLYGRYDEDTEQDIAPVQRPLSAEEHMELRIQVEKLLQDHQLLAERYTRARVALEAQDQILETLRVARGVVR